MSALRPRSPSLELDPGLDGRRGPTGSVTAVYDVLGTRIRLTSDVPDAFARIDASYAPFASEPVAGVPEAASLELLLLPGGNGFAVRDSEEPERAWASVDEAVVDGLNRLTRLVLSHAHERGRIVTVHAGVVSDAGGALILAGPSGSGKTTTTLGLVRRGLGLLSDELAVIDVETRSVLPYRRSFHIRPDTIELFPELGFLRDRPRHELGGGSEWALSHEEIAERLPGACAAPAPLGAVLLLDGRPDPSRPPRITPVPAALASMELLRGAWNASVDFGGTLSMVLEATAGARCGRLVVGELEATVEAVARWLEVGTRG